MNYLYFAGADVNTGGSTAAREGLCVPASSYIGANPTTNATTAFLFQSSEGTDGGVQQVTLTHGTNKNKLVIKAFMAAMNSHTHSTGFVVMTDMDVAGASKDSVINAAFRGLGVTGISIRETDASSVLAATHGAGAISTFMAPRTRRWTENGVIVTEIKVDLTGLKAKGDAADDVIGLGAGGAAYLYRNVVADNGIIFKQTVSCIELPTQASGTITTDIDMNWNANAALAYDGAAGTSELNMGTLVTGETFEFNVPALTANDYLYLTEGDSAATAGVYSGGQFIIRLFGHQLFV